VTLFLCSGGELSVSERRLLKMPPRLLIYLQAAPPEQSRRSVSAEYEPLHPPLPYPASRIPGRETGINLHQAKVDDRDVADYY